MRHIPSVDRERMKRMTTDELRAACLVQGLFQPGQLELAHWETERTVAGGAVPLGQELCLEAPAALVAEYFCERRELGVVNLGGAGSVKVDGADYALERGDALYVGRGSRDVRFSSADAATPARFYLLSYPAHASYPTTLARRADAETVRLGTQEEGNVRTLRRQIHPAQVATCQLVMGTTEMEPGSVWNSFPPHTHARRSEVYLYYGLEDGLVMHLCGEPTESRHLVTRDFELTLSPPWSLHAGVGTRAYGFVWGMGGENQVFADMDHIPVSELR